MIREFEFYHGAVFTCLLHGMPREVSIQLFPTQDNASYVIDNKIGIYIKYSSKRLSPWTFSFQSRHQDEIAEMKNKIGFAFVLLVCNDDGVVVLSFEELKQILDQSNGGTEWISVARNRREMYSVKGSNGKLQFKIGKNDFPSKIFNRINQSPTKKEQESAHLRSEGNILVP